MVIRRMGILTDMPSLPSPLRDHPAEVCCDERHPQRCHCCAYATLKTRTGTGSSLLPLQPEQRLYTAGWWVLPCVPPPFTPVCGWHRTVLLEGRQCVEQQQPWDHRLGMVLPFRLLVDLCRIHTTIIGLPTGMVMPRNRRKKNKKKNRNSHLGIIINNIIPDPMGIMTSPSRKDATV